MSTKTENYSSYVFQIVDGKGVNTLKIQPYGTEQRISGWFGNDRVYRAISQTDGTVRLTVYDSRKGRVRKLPEMHYVIGPQGDRILNNPVWLDRCYKLFLPDGDFTTYVAAFGDNYAGKTVRIIKGDLVLEN